MVSVELTKVEVLHSGMSRLKITGWSLCKEQASMENCSEKGVQLRNFTESTDRDVQDRIVKGIGTWLADVLSQIYITVINWESLLLQKLFERTTVNISFPQPIYVDFGASPNYGRGGSSPQTPSGTLLFNTNESSQIVSRGSVRKGSKCPFPRDTFKTHCGATKHQSFKETDVEEAAVVLWLLKRKKKRREVQQLGLSTTSKDEKLDDGKWLHYCFGLTYLDPEEVGVAFSDIMRMQPFEERLTKYVDYLTENYINEDKEPPFPPSNRAGKYVDLSVTTNASPMSSLVLTDSSQLTSDSQHLDYNGDPFETRRGERIRRRNALSLYFINRNVRNTFPYQPDCVPVRSSPIRTLLNYSNADGHLVHDADWLRARHVTTASHSDLLLASPLYPPPFPPP
uniref:Uncharacterized protein n=1 Tax=Timema cristinae TaxID=61476 RepID=A0A7R9D1Y4_TIMCR|nr:unnamed protein product [Timema cristinae]